MRVSPSLPLVALAGLCLATTAAAAPAGGPSLAPADCFRSRDWQGWSSPNPEVIYLSVRGEVYRVDLMGGGPPLEGPGKLIISETVGSDQVCRAIDLDIRLGDTSGFSTPLFPTGITKLTPDQVAALPPNQAP